jgi:methionyl-tRNA formyltransferase
VFPQRTPDDGQVDWSWPARRVYDFVRAQTRPYPGAFILVNGERVQVWRARVADADATGFRMACGDGQMIELVEVGYRGKTMSGAEFLACIGEGLAHEAHRLD